MKKNLITLLAGAALLASCTTVEHTADTLPIKPVAYQHPTVADLDVDSVKASGTTEWNFSLLPVGNASPRLRRQNLVADILSETGADVLVEPQVKFTKKTFGKRTLTISGYRARLRNFRPATDHDLAALRLMAGEGCRPGEATCCPGSQAPGCNAGAAPAVVPAAKKQKKSKAPAAKEYRWLFRTGIVSAGLPGSEDDNMHRRAGYDFTLGFNKRLGKSPVYYSAEAGLGCGGAKYDEPYYDFTHKTMFHTVSVSPVTFGVKIPLGQHWKLDGHFGAYYSYEIASHEEGAFLYGRDIEKYDEEGHDGGFRLGGGIWYKRFNFDITWQRGFATKFEMQGNSSNHYQYKELCSSNVMFRLGIAF